MWAQRYEKMLNFHIIVNKNTALSQKKLACTKSFYQSGLSSRVEADLLVRDVLPIFCPILSVTKCRC